MKTSFSKNVILQRQDLHKILQRQLGFKNIVSPPDMAKWTALASAVDKVTTPVRIAIVGKYTGLQDSYLSVIKVLHTGRYAVESLVCCLSPPSPPLLVWRVYIGVVAAKSPGSSFHMGVESPNIGVGYWWSHATVVLFPKVFCLNNLASLLYCIEFMLPIAVANVRSFFHSEAPEVSSYTTMWVRSLHSRFSGSFGISPRIIGHWNVI